MDISHSSLRLAARRIAVTGFVTLAIPLAVALPASAAPASHPTAYDTKTQYLAGDPNTGDPMSCTSRSIFLEPGTYQYEIYGYNPNSSPAGTRETPDLSGWYTWQDCLQPLNGFYQWTSILISQSTNEEAAELGVLEYYGGNGVYTWGSQLIPPY